MSKSSSRRSRAYKQSIILRQPHATLAQNHRNEERCDGQQHEHASGGLFEKQEPVALGSRECVSQVFLTHRAENHADDDGASSES
jgi:hypothetical protein